MDVQTLTFLIVGATFILYIGIAIWARPPAPESFMLPMVMCRPSPTAWQPPRTG